MLSLFSKTILTPANDDDDVIYSFSETKIFKRFVSLSKLFPFFCHAQKAIYFSNKVNNFRKKIC